MESLMLPGSQLTRLAENLGMARGVLGAVAQTVSANPANARQILDAFAPLSNGALIYLDSQSLPAAGSLRRPYAYYAGHFAGGTPFHPGLAHQYVGRMLARCINPQHISGVIENLAASLQNTGMNPAQFLDPSAGLDVQLSQAIQGFMQNLNTAIQQKLNEMFPPPAPPKRRKKKGGIGKKLKKGLKKFNKVAKSVGKIGKNMFKGVVSSFKGIFKGNFFKNIFTLGTGLLGGLIGGPIGSQFIGQLAQVGIGKLLGKKNSAKLNQVFGQMNNMFNVLGNIQKMNAIPTNGLTGFIRA